MRAPSSTGVFFYVVPPSSSFLPHSLRGASLNYFGLLRFLLLFLLSLFFFFLPCFLLPLGPLQRLTFYLLFLLFLQPLFLSPPSVFLGLLPVTLSFLFLILCVPFFFRFLAFHFSFFPLSSTFLSGFPCPLILSSSFLFSPSCPSAFFFLLFCLPSCFRSSASLPHLSLWCLSGSLLVLYSSFIRSSPPGFPSAAWFFVLTFLFHA